jgi:hypothetical protein
MGKERQEGEMRNDGKVYWPGTDIEQSRNNGFTMGLRQSDDEWKGITASDLARANSTAFVEKSRTVRGVDPGSFYGISRKADEAMRISRHGGAYARAKAAKSPKAKSGTRGPAVGFGLSPNSKTGVLRALLAAGPKTGAELAAGAGMQPTNICGLLKNDVRRKRVVKIVRPGEVIRYALAEAA